MNKFMRIMIFFDLPTADVIDRKRYSKFRRFLLNDGYDMLQYSIYSRICNGPDNVEKHVKRLEKHLPSRGSIRMLVLTEKQFVHMRILVGENTTNEKIIDLETINIF